MDRILELVGDFGNYQAILCFLVGFICSLTSILVFASVFNGAEPALICSFKNETTEIFFSQQTSCEVWTNHIRNNHASNVNDSYQCVFDKDLYGQTYVTEWELVCDQRYQASFIQTMYVRHTKNTVLLYRNDMFCCLICFCYFHCRFFFGAFTSMLLGFVADKYGRWHSSVSISLALFVVLTTGEILQFVSFDFSKQTKYTLYCITQFVSGFLIRGLYCIAYTFLIEFTTTRHSTLITNIYLYSYVVGELVLLALAYTIRNWHILNIIFAVFSLIVTLLLVFLLSEPPRFLVSKKQHENAAKVLVRMALVNGKGKHLTHGQILEEMTTLCGTSSADSKPNVETHSFKSILKQIFTPHANLAKSFMFVYIWTSLYLLFFGVSLGNLISNFSSYRFN